MDWLSRFINCLVTGTNCAAQEAKIAALEKDAAYYQERIAALTGALAKAVEVPDISAQVVNRTVVTPYSIVRGYRGTYDTLCADSEYYALRMNDWVAVLTSVQPQVTKVLEEWKQEIADCYIPEEASWGLGLFLAEGSCGFRDGLERGAGAWWRISNTDISLLKRAKKGFEEYFNEEFPHLAFKITSYPSEKKGTKTNFGIRRESLNYLEVYTKEFNKHRGERRDFIKKFRDSFYLFGDKKIPAAFWEKGNRKSKLSFLEGYLAGDGRKGKPYADCWMKSQYAAIGLIECMINVNWKFQVKKRRQYNREYICITADKRLEYMPFLLDYIDQKGGAMSWQDIDSWMKVNYPTHDIAHGLRILEKTGFIKRKYARPSTGRYQEVTKIKDWPEACDDWALVMASFVTCAFKAAGLDKQGAFCVIWSNSHAYNGFITADGKFHVYEPQNNSVVGELSKTSDIYETRYIWFLG